MNFTAHKPATTAKSLAATHRAVIERDYSTCIAKIAPHCTGEHQQTHHRRPRGMGGSSQPDTNQSANLICLCSPCHNWIESNRKQALENGWLVTQAQIPSEELVMWRGHWTKLDNEGGLTRA